MQQKISLICPSRPFFCVLFFRVVSRNQKQHNQDNQKRRGKRSTGIGAAYKASTRRDRASRLVVCKEKKRNTNKPTTKTLTFFWSRHWPCVFFQPLSKGIQKKNEKGRATLFSSVFRGAGEIGPRYLITDRPKKMDDTFSDNGLSIHFVHRHSRQGYSLKVCPTSIAKSQKKRSSRPTSSTYFNVQWGGEKKAASQGHTTRGDFVASRKPEALYCCHKRIGHTHWNNSQAYNNTSKEKDRKKREKGHTRDSGMCFPKKRERKRD